MLFTLYLPMEKSEPWRQKLARVDFAGAGMLVTAVSVLMFGLDQGVMNSWTSPLTVTMLSAAPVLFVAFLLVETKYAKEPVAPSQVLFERTSLACLMCNFCSYGTWLALIYHLSLYFQAV